MIPSQSHPIEGTVQNAERHRLLDDGAAWQTFPGTQPVDPRRIVRARHQNPAASGEVFGRGCIEINAIAVGQVHVADDRFGSSVASGKAADSRAGIVERPTRRDVMATALKVLANFRPEILVILDKKDPHSHPAGRQSDTTLQ